MKSARFVEEFAMEYDRQGGVKDDAKGSEVCLANLSVVYKLQCNLLMWYLTSIIIHRQSFNSVYDYS